MFLRAGIAPGSRGRSDLRQNKILVQRLPTWSEGVFQRNTPDLHVLARQAWGRFGLAGVIWPLGSRTDSLKPCSRIAASP
ncbi:hypothetical protein R0J92_21175, partial [Tritonibacter sp. SIMBA_163]